MVKLDRFDIEFNNAESAYFAGQEVSGKVNIDRLFHYLLINSKVTTFQDSTKTFMNSIKMILQIHITVNHFC